ncbi:C4-dicarboxylate TRAP transporter substrate-binding protein [Alloalcanivorax mobilis]|uniref:C4-dicarboxylate TRAP transporter substrate-binding protein n=1 Tax=Alloalcanivorax mobilis TaxID=2019569 RepID=UPI001E41B363|nr:C4-dicarboxylate TRAP transporter substrate-binding protein [Alloalcanivorax mobilis]
MLEVFIMQRTTKRATVLLCALGFFCVSSVALASTTLRYATGYPPGSLPADAAQEYAKKVEQYSDGELKLKVYALSLLNASETSDGIRSGIADGGYLLTVYFPSMYPHTNLVNESSMQLSLFDQDQLNGKGALAFEGAMAEFTFFHCPECLKEYQDQGQIYTANAASSSYGLLCNKPVTNEAQLKGKRLRVAGSHWSRWSDRFGATSMSMTINDTLEALSQGVIDCTISSAPELINLGLLEAVTDITMTVPGGVYAGANAGSFNLGKWRGLNENQRQAILRAGAYFTAATPWSYLELEQEALRRAKEGGATLHQADPALVQASREFTEKDLNTIIAYYKDKHGVERGEEMLKTFKELLTKWVGLVQPVDSLDQLETLYWDQVFSKVDAKTYGME